MNDKLLVAGSRSFAPSRFLSEKEQHWEVAAIQQRIYHLSTTWGIPFSTVIHGGAKGIDSIAGDWATKVGLEVEMYPADWERHGKGAGYLRNVEMVRACSHAVVIWDGISKGTKHTIDLLVDMKKPHVVFVWPS